MKIALQKGNRHMPKRTTKTEPTTKPKASAKKTTATARKTTRTAVAPKRTVRTARVATAPSRDDVARRAYELFERRGGGHGADLDDWFRAEAELLAQQR